MKGNAMSVLNTVLVEFPDGGALVRTASGHYQLRSRPGSLIPARRVTLGQAAIAVVRDGGVVVHSHALTGHLRTAIAMERQRWAREQEQTP